MLDPGLGPEWKPEKAKLIVYRDREKEEILVVAVDPAFPDAWTKPLQFHAAIRIGCWRRERGRFVMVRIGTRWIAVLPDRTVEFRNVEDEFVLIRERGPTGRT